MQVGEQLLAALQFLSDEGILWLKPSMPYLLYPGLAQHSVELPKSTVRSAQINREFGIVWPRKAHILAHCVLRLRVSPCYNPWNGCTWRDEDMIGRVMSVVAAVHQRSIGTKVVQFCAARLGQMMKD